MRCPPVGHSAPVAQLDFPAREICQDQDVAFAHKGGAYAVDQCDTGRHMIDAAARFVQVFNRIKFFQPPGGHDSKDRVFGDLALNLRVDFRGRQREVVTVDCGIDFERGE